MGLLGKLFGRRVATLDELRRLLAQQRFAEARLLAEDLAGQELSAEGAAELESLRAAAGDGLARLNLDEALGLQRSRAEKDAEAHLRLALEQVCSPQLRREIEQALAGGVQPEVIPPPPAHGGAACSSCTTAATPAAAVNAELPDAESQFELVLTSYPLVMAESYRLRSALFKQAFLLSHAGEDRQALPLWKQVKAAEQDALYWFEYGAALARAEEPAKAQRALEKALQLAPGLLLASEALITALLAQGKAQDALAYLQAQLAAGGEPAFCHAQLAQLYLHLQQPEAGLEQVRLAMQAGVNDPEFIQLAATLYEQAGDFAGAEALLRRLPAGGCGGGISLPLAEFLLRRRQELARVLDAFNGACRKEPDNPRWQLRVAQTYVARNWHKDGEKLLAKVLGDPRLDAQLRAEAEALAGELK